MRVLLTNDRAPGTDGGGAEVYLDRVARGLSAAGADVEVFTGPVARGGPARALDLWDPAVRRRLARVAQAFRPDVVHHNNVLRELSPSVLAVRAAAGTVLTVHDRRVLGGSDPDVPAMRRAADLLAGPALRRYVRRRVDATVAVSAPLARELAAARFPRVSVVAVPGAPPAVPPADVAACHDVVFAGRLSPDKGFDVLLAAFRRLAPSHPLARLVVAGEGPLRETVDALAAELPGRVLPRGRLGWPQLSAVYGAARVVAVPSVPARRGEGTPLVAVEALLHGRPVVAADDPGLGALLEATGGGVSVPAGDPAALAGALDGLLADGARAARLGSQGRQAAQAAHSPEAVAAELLRIYHDLQDRGRG